MRKKRARCGLAFGLILALAGTALCGDKSLVALVRNKGGLKSFNLYDIRAAEYTEKDIHQTVGTEFEDDLARCTVLLAASKSNPTTRAVFLDKKYHKPLRDFLARGGTVFFGRTTFYRCATDFLKSVGVNEPQRYGEDTLKSYRAELTGDAKVLSESPNEVGKSFGSGHGAWTDVPPGFTVLARMAEPPHSAALIERTGVEGKGRILFSQLTGALSTTSDRDKAVFENLWSCLLGEDIKAEGPGKARGLVDPYRAAVPAANPLYLSRAADIPWWDKEYGSRLPVVVAEPVGLSRSSAPVSIILTNSPATVAVVTDYGTEVVSQVTRRHNGGMDVVFQTDLDPYENKLFYVYTSNGKQTA